MVSSLENILPPPGEADSRKSEDNTELSHAFNFDIAYARLEDGISDEPQLSPRSFFPASLKLV